MVVEVIPRQVGKHRPGHQQTICPALIERMGRNFHGRRATALGLDLGQHPINLHHIRSGVGGRLQTARHAVANSANDAAGRSGFLQQLGNILGNRRFAVGPGDTNQPQALRRVLEKARSNAAEPTTQVRHRHDKGAMSLTALSHLRCLQEDYGCAAPDRLIHIVVGRCRRAGHCHEGVPGTDFTAVRSQSVDGHIEDGRHRHNAL